MPALQPPPVPPALRPPPVPPAVADDRPDDRRDAVAVVDGFVFAIYRSGFVQSLILHLVVLLALALIVIRPDLPPPAVLTMEFAALQPEPEPDALAAVALPDPEPPEIDPPEDAAAMPVEELVDLEPALAIDAVDPVAFAADDPLAAPDAEALALDVPVPARLRGGVAPPAAAGGDAAGLGGGIGGEIGGEIGQRLKAAGAGTGDVQVSIAWNDVNDIDLHVMVEPLGQPNAASIINFTNRVGIAGGCLDVDRNVQPTTRTPVENVFWGRGQAPFGRYTVAVHHYRAWAGAGSTPVDVVVLVDGEESRFRVVLQPGDPPRVVTVFQRLPPGEATVASGATYPAPGPPRSPGPGRGFGPGMPPRR